MSEETIFGKIVNGEIPCDEVFSDPYCLAFRDNQPQGPVHILVIPRKPIESLNKKLDPNLHQAMMEIEDDSKEPGTVVQEIQKGFMMKDRLLRPSLVAVSKKTNIKDKNLKQDQKSEENQSKSNEN